MVVVTLTHWFYPRVTVGSSRDRWSIEFEGKTLLTYGSEFEARRAAHQRNWTIAEDTPTHAAGARGEEGAGR